MSTGGSRMIVKDCVRLRWLRRQLQSTQERYPSKWQRGNFCLLRFRPGPIHSSFKRPASVEVETVGRLVVESSVLCNYVDRTSALAQRRYGGFGELEVTRSSKEEVNRSRSETEQTKIPSLRICGIAFVSRLQLTS
ncbi:hypothetical protein CEXT_650041 [Caerostris extrusa]|uniref:Uncharacterized protein n=1 Tax=Caerostris extrusa TaxID=172846 RepID=A0AAV4MY17_CAEEX|nr:hypothetical protein CEXT_650041 [Caerostris extrusa]